jgi:hypothetical protein
MKLAISILALTLAACGGASAEAHVNAGPEPGASSDRALEHAGWEKLGQREVDGKVDHDVIEVGRADGRFRTIVLEVKDGSMEMFDMVVTFGDGERFEPKTRLVFDANTRSREIALPGGERIIKRVDFKYGNIPGGGRARVELFAAK